MSKENENGKINLESISSQSELESLMHIVEKDAISSMLVDLEKKKEEVIRAKLIEMGKSEEFIDNQKNRRFKDVVCERIDGPNQSKETWWLNDGSETGQRIVTFVMVKQFPSFNPNMRQTVMGFKYEYF